MAAGGPREVAETCLDLLLIELIDQNAHPDTPESTATGKIDRLAFDVGRSLAARASAHKPVFSEHLDCIKFICKDFWVQIYGKQVDNLRTNNKGIYVVQDNHVRWLARISGRAAMRDDPAAQRLARLYAQFPCGLIRGGLHNFGIESTVTADTSSIPACTFTVSLMSAKPLATAGASAAAP